MLYSNTSSNPNKNQDDQSTPKKKAKKPFPKKKEFPGYMWNKSDLDSLDPKLHAFSADDKSDRCFYCNTAKSSHVKAIVVDKDGDRKIISL